MWLVCLAAAGGQARATDEPELWLPKRYQKYYLKLVKAANVAEETERCESVVRGSLHQSRSTPEHPVYRIVCRDFRHKTFSVLVDGVTFEDLTPPEKRRQRVSAEDLERMRSQKYWDLCRKALEHKTRLMMELEWLTTEMPAPDKSAPGEMTFAVDFNARSIQKQSLRYRALCTFVESPSAGPEEELGVEAEPAFELKVKIVPRRG